MLSGPQSYMESNRASNWYSLQCNLQCRIQTGVEFVECLNTSKSRFVPRCWAAHSPTWKVIVLLIDIHSNAICYIWRIQTGVEFCWVTQHLQKQICSTLLFTICCLNYFAKMLSGPQSYMESNSASNWYSFQCNLLCRIQTGVELCWVTQHLQMQICSTLLVLLIDIHYNAICNAVFSQA